MLIMKVGLYKFCYNKIKNFHSLKKVKDNCKASRNFKAYIINKNWIGFTNSSNHINSNTMAQHFAYHLGSPFSL